MQEKRLTAQFNIQIASPASAVFPLLCPVEELKWIPGWRYDMIFSSSGRNEDNCMFAEYMTGPHFFGPGHREPSIWTTTRYDETNHVIHFLITSAKMYIRLEIGLKAPDANSTDVTWSMTATPVNEKGNALMDGEMEKRMSLMLMFLSNLLKNYCEKK